MDGRRCHWRDHSLSNEDQCDAVPNDSSVTPGSRIQPKYPYSLRSRKRAKSSISPCNLTSSSSETTYWKPPKYSRYVADVEVNSKYEDGKVFSQDSSSAIEIIPTKIKSPIRFNDVGGLDHHVEQLKEMILLPRLIPHLRERISPPRGVLFYGPPGTGKTLVARALAGEFSRGDHKMTFFARKGADCLGKYVGDSEKQLCRLFEKAYEMRPSIIFFDEIDGLAPSRSHVQEHVHHSVVATLLSLMDGLEDRGEVIVIGATNRIDAIDPALRRPGRFDREFYFPLPSLDARRNIIRIHTKKWKPSLSEEQIENIATDTTGYCGADLKALCTEATLVYLRRCYPNFCAPKEKAVIKGRDIRVLPQDFKTAMKKIVPAMQRQATSSFGPLPSNVKSLLQDALSKALAKVDHVFGMIKHNTANKCHISNLDLPNIYRPRILITGGKDQGQTRYIAPAILHHLENIPNHTIDLPTICSSFDQNAERCCVQIFCEAKRNMPSIIYLPSIENTWEALDYVQQQNLLLLLRDIPCEAPIMILATSDCSFENLPSDIKELFDGRKEVIIMSSPTNSEREQFFSEILNEIQVDPRQRGIRAHAIDLSNIDEVSEHDKRNSRYVVEENKSISKFCVDKKRLKTIHEELVYLTKDWTISQVEKFGNCVAHLIYNQRKEMDKKTLLDNIEQEIQNWMRDQ